MTRSEALQSAKPILFSRAKGGKPVDKNIRGLAWVAVRWALLVRPRVIMLENVPEIRTWGPLDGSGKPIKSRSGETFDGFIKALTEGIPSSHPAFKEMCETLEIKPDGAEAEKLVKGLGYNLKYKILRSCDYGAPTTRTRFYLIARCDGKPIVFPPPTHGNKAGLKPYHTAAECIDWSIPAKSIFEREKPLAENTLRRIARGIRKFVIDNPNPFIVTVNHGGDCFRGQNINEPLNTITAKNGYGIVTPTIMSNNTGNIGASADAPLPTVTTGNRNYVIAPTLIQYHSETASDEVRGQEVSEPLDTITAVDHNALVTAHILTMRNNMDGQKMDEPLSTISCSGAHHAEVQAFLVKYFSTGAAKPVDKPLDTITTKDRFGLVTIHGEDYIITDIRMRMLTPRELFNAQGFPPDYIIDRDDKGNPYPKTKQVARCGNAVTPPVPAALVRANLPEMCEGRRLNDSQTIS